MTDLYFLIIHSFNIAFIVQYVRWLNEQVTALKRREVKVHPGTDMLEKWIFIVVQAMHKLVSSMLMIDRF
jgi:hypothetical protein